MRRFGKVDSPQGAFIAALKVDSWAEAIEILNSRDAKPCPVVRGKFRYARLSQRRRSRAPAMSEALNTRQSAGGVDFRRVMLTSRAELAAQRNS
jgi:hypothetical protein